MALKIHLLIEDPSGPIPTGEVTGAIKFGKKGKLRAACDPEGKIAMGGAHRGTGEPWGVRCEACKATEEFKALDRPKPTVNPDDDETEPEEPVGG